MSGKITVAGSISGNYLRWPCQCPPKWVEFCQPAFYGAISGALVVGCPPPSQDWVIGNLRVFRVVPGEEHGIVSGRAG